VSLCESGHLKNYMSKVAGIFFQKEKSRENKFFTRILLLLGVGSRRAVIFQWIRWNHCKIEEKAQNFWWFKENENGVKYWMNQGTSELEMRIKSSWEKLREANRGFKKIFDEILSFFWWEKRGVEFWPWGLYEISNTMKSNWVLLTVYTYDTILSIILCFDEDNVFVFPAFWEKCEVFERIRGLQVFRV